MNGFGQQRYPAQSRPPTQGRSPRNRRAAYRLILHQLPPIFTWKVHQVRAAVIRMAHQVDVEVPMGREPYQRGHRVVGDESPAGSQPLPQ